MLPRSMNVKFNKLLQPSYMTQEHIPLMTDQAPNMEFSSPPKHTDSSEADLYNDKKVR